MNILKTIINGYLQEDLLMADVDLVDIEIIKYFQQFAMSKNMKHLESEGKLYFWLSYQKLVDDLPIININSKRTIARRFDSLEQKGIFEKVIKNEGMRNFTYFRLTNLHQSWIENIEKKFVINEKIEPVKDTGKNERFNEFWNEYPRKTNKKGSKSIYDKKIDEAIHLLIIKDLKKRKSFEEWTKDDGKYIPHPPTYLNQERWNDEYQTNGNTSRYDVPIL